MSKNMKNVIAAGTGLVIGYGLGKLALSISPLAWVGLLGVEVGAFVYLTSKHINKKSN